MGTKLIKLRKLKNASINYQYIPKIMHSSFLVVQTSKLFNYTLFLKAINIEYQVTRQCRKRQDHDAIKQDFGYKTMGLHIISSFRAEWRITEHDWKSRSYEKKIKIRSHTRARTHTDIYDCQIMLQLRPLLLGLQVSLRVGGITLFFVLNLGIIPVFIAYDLVLGVYGIRAMWEGSWVLFWVFLAYPRIGSSVPRSASASG